MNYWAIAFPSLMYLASVCACSTLRYQTAFLSSDFTMTAMGIAFIYQFSRPDSITKSSLSVAHFGTPFISISLALNLILTLMIVVRLAWHNKNIRNAMGASSGIGGLSRAVATILTESFALYAINFILYIRPYGTASIFQFLFWPILAETQVRVSPRTYLPYYVAILRHCRAVAIGYRPIPHHHTSCEAESIDERGHRLRGSWLDSISESRGIDG